MATEQTPDSSTQNGGATTHFGWIAVYADRGECHPQTKERLFRLEAVCTTPRDSDAIFSRLRDEGIDAVSVLWGGPLGTLPAHRQPWKEQES